MFDAISSKLSGIIRRISGSGIISEKNIDEALKEIRMSLLEADVNYKVVKQFIDGVKQRSLGAEVLRSLSPDRQFVKIVHDELVSFLGGRDSRLDISKPPALIMLIGLQGSGKTTTAGKLAMNLIKGQGLKKILLVAADTHRPAAREQLKKLSEQAGAGFYTEPGNDAVRITVNAWKKTGDEFYDAVIFDTAGRLHIDGDLINELKRMKTAVPFTEILLVADSMLGQEAVNVAKNFNEALGITGMILTKTDGDARGGAALSMKYTANVPIKFIGTGEKLDKLEDFHPDRAASRILGMGDVVSLVEKVRQNVSMEQAKKAEEKFRKATFNLDDFLEQLRALKNMGPMDEMLKMLPGAGKMGLNSVNVDENDLKHIEAIILSMTPKERNHPEVIDESRRKRIAKGSGTAPEKVSRLLKQFAQTKKMMKQFGKKRHGGGFPGMGMGF